MENYTKLEVLGDGSYGTVYKCKHKLTKQIVAIKRFKDYDLQSKKVAMREIKMLSICQHEHIIQLQSVFIVKNRYYLIFEYMEKTLLQKIDESRTGLSLQMTLIYFETNIECYFLFTS